MHVLAIGAHPDDIELGCGGALLAHRRRGDDVTMLVMTTGEHGPRDSSSRMAEQEEATSMLGAHLVWGELEDGEVPDGRPTIIAIERAFNESGADVVYTHAPADTHQDHRAVAVASLSALRRATRVLCYETPTSVEFIPSLYVSIEGLVEAKLDLLRAHMSQVLKSGLVDLEEVEARARYRGFSGRVRQAEAFEVHRFLWDTIIGDHVPSGFGRHAHVATEE